VPADTDVRPRADVRDGCPVLVGYDPLEQETVNDPSPWLTLARSEAPVFYVPEHDEWVVSRYADVVQVLSDPETFSSKDTIEIQPAPPEVAAELPYGFALETNVGNTDPPGHARLRQLIQPAFARKQALLKADLIKDLANRTLDQIIARGSADLIPDYCHPIPVRVMSSILGIPEEDAPRAYQWAVELIQLFGNPKIDHDEHVRLARGQVAFEAYVTALIEQRRLTPGGQGDFITNLINARAETGAPVLSDREILGTVTGTIFAGSETAASSLALIIHPLLAVRSRWEEVLADRSLVDAAIEEGLRLNPPTRASRRTTTRPVEIGSVQLPGGAAVRVHWWSADRDEAMFKDSGEFDMHRENSREHVTFGRGPHACPGSHLARLEIRIALETLLDRVPSLRLVPGHRLMAALNKTVPSMLSGLVVEWDERS
jgi:cytochrome P450